MRSRSGDRSSAVRVATYDPLGRAPRGMAKFDAAHARAAVNTAAALRRAEQAQFQSKFQSMSQSQFQSQSESQFQSQLRGFGESVRLQNGGGRRCRAGTCSAAQATKESSAHTPILHYKELTEAFYENYQGGALAREVYLHYMAAVNSRRAGTKSVDVRRRQMKEKQREEFRHLNVSHLNDTAKANAWSRGNGFSNNKYEKENIL